MLSAQVGAAGLAGTLAAALAGKVICLANKESLVLAGDLVRRVCARTGAVVLPVDSEHNAIFQCLAGRGQEVQRLILTASGGPLRGWSREALGKVTIEQALNHPNQGMGAITIDSATLMNKGLEVIEAFHLYGLPVERIKVLVHPQFSAFVVEFHDGVSWPNWARPTCAWPLPPACSGPAACRSMCRRSTLRPSRLPSTSRTNLHFPALDWPGRCLKSVAAAALCSTPPTRLFVLLMMGAV